MPYNDPDVLVEQRFVIKYFFRLNKSATECFRLLQAAYRDQTMCRRAVFKWHKRFKNGSEQVITPPHSGRPVSASNIMQNMLDILLAEDDSLTQCQIAALMSISKGTVQMFHKKLQNTLEGKFNMPLHKWLVWALYFN